MEAGTTDYNANSPHSFVIPVMGTGYTLITPLSIGKYGISSVMSAVDDLLMDQLRGALAKKAGEPFEPIPSTHPDCRAERITTFLNFVHRRVQRETKALQASPFKEGSEITRYYTMLPDCPLKQTYVRMLECQDPTAKRELQEQLRVSATPGSIDVNIMTKLNRDRYEKGEKLPPEFSDAMSALRGYANSTLSSSLVFSAGMSPRLFSYLASNHPDNEKKRQFPDFFPNEEGELKKHVILKVSDYRSARIQGKILAKKGLWVSEFRVESGLNCGGHAFATQGLLMGPILKEFKENRQDLLDELVGTYKKGLASINKPMLNDPKVCVRAQGGIGTPSEDKFLRTYYNLDGTGWGTLFLLVPEATNVDSVTLNKLIAATRDDVYLSNSSPVGVPFWNLKSSSSELERIKRIEQGKPGSTCPKQALVSNTEFTRTPVCTASRAYQKPKLEQLAEEDLTEEQRNAQTEQVLEKSCICHELGGGAQACHGIEPAADAAICPGPSITDFSGVFTLTQMTNHIYGREPIPTPPDRPHMFIRELQINMERLEKKDAAPGLKTSSDAYFQEYAHNLASSITYYEQLAESLPADEQERFKLLLSKEKKTLTPETDSTVIVESQKS